MTRPLLHVVNGDATLAVLRRAALPGEAVAWPDMLMEGPLRSVGDGGLDWASRVRYLASAYAADRRAAAARIRAFRKALELAAGSGGEAVLWFEEDFFCQIHLVYLLANLPPALRRSGRLSIICPEMPLGRMSPKRLERLFACRSAPGRDRLRLAALAWKALRDPAGATGRSPGAARRRLAAFLARKPDFSAWPLLRRGLEARLDSLPDGNGHPGSLAFAIGEVLVEADGGGLPFPDLFRAVSAHRRIKPLGLGDAQVARALLDLAAGKDAPVRILGEGKTKPPRNPMDFRGARIALAGAR